MHKLEIYYKKNNDGEYEIKRTVFYQSFIKLLTDIVCQYRGLYLMDNDCVCVGMKDSHATNMDIFCNSILRNEAELFVFYVANYKFVVKKDDTEICLDTEERKTNDYYNF